MIKVSKSFVIFLLLVVCTFTFMPNNVVLGASENFLDINTTTFSSRPSASDLNLDDIKKLIFSVNSSLDLTDYNTLITRTYNTNCLTLALYRDDIFDKTKFYYNSETNKIIISKSDITIPMKFISINFTLNDDGTYTRIVKDYISSVSDSGNFPNNTYSFTFDDYFHTNFDIIDKNTGELVKLADIDVEKDAEIGDKSSRLKLSYEYNEDYTECKINATLENGAFTDKIFYSNYMPSIAGQGLLSKQAFPTNGITVTENQSLFFQAEDKDRQYISY